MQTMTSNGASSAPSTSSLTTAQVHQGQLQDYELLLSILRGEVGSLSHFSQTLIKPRTFSPLDQENETGQDALQQLLEDPDYQALCQNNKVSPHYLIVTLKNGAFVYETSNRDGANKTELTLTGNAKWQTLRTRIEKTVALLGGQIRYDRLVSAPRIATFYGMAPWDPTQSAEHQAAIDTLEEKIASYQLGLEEDFSILDLKPGFTKGDRQVSFQAVSIAASQDEMHGQFIMGEIKKAIQTFLPEGVASPLTHLANDILVSAMPERVRAQPTVFLQKILQSPVARKLGDVLLSTMDWYGGKPGEETSPQIRTKVVANALQIWFKSQIIEYPDRIAGYDLQSNSSWGKSYKNIWREFENHLLTSKRAASEKEAIVMARLLLCQFPAEFRITDIPIDLPYRGSAVWVNFVNGVNLINSTDPKALYRRTFQQLVNLPLQLSDGATKEQLYDVSLARLLPTVDWAFTQGVIPQKKYEEYTQTELERAVSELDKYINALNDSLIKLNKAAPERLSIAKTVVENYLHVYDGDSRSSTFWSEHKLAKVPPGAYLNPQDYVIEQYSIIDVVAEDKLDSREPWSIFKNNGPLTEYSISIDEHRQVHAGGSLLIFSGDSFPDVKGLFEQKFKSYMTSLTLAYETLIRSLLISLPFSDRQALELGKLSVYTLRKETYRIEAKHETPEKILPRRARNGLLLLATYKGVTHTFELLPRAGVIRRINNLDPNLFGGILRYENWPTGGMNPYSVEVLRHKTLPFDWNAHSTGSKPLNAASCEAIIEQLGHTFIAPTSSMENVDSVALTINSNRCREISNFIATQLLFVDPTVLRDSAYGQTKFDRDEVSQKRREEIIKMFVPFWKSIEDITSGDTERMVNGAFGLLMDLVSFGLPIGKFASGSTKLLSNASRLTVRTRLTAFASLTKELLILTLQAMNPIDDVGSLLKALGSRGLKLGRSRIFRIKAMAGKAGQYNFVHSLPQINNAGRWRPLASGDMLATVRGIDDVPIRNMASVGEANYRLVDPISSKPYGPSLTPGELSLGRSHYSLLERNDSHVMVEVTENARVRDLIEVDGSTTVFIDNVSYRLDEASLRRVDTLDADKKLELKVCRPRRGLDDQAHCHSYVTKGTRDTPPIGSFDETKGYALWFGDKIYTPAPAKPRQKPRLVLNGSVYEGFGETLQKYKGDLKNILKTPYLVSRESVAATMEFQKGIYGRVKVTGTAEEIDDTRQVGAIIVDSIDGAKTHIFTQLNADDFYFTEIAKGADMRELTLKKASQADLAEGTVGGELIVVFNGSLTANNMARIHGIPSVERAVKAMEDIAVPIGGHAKPADTLKWLTVDTSPGEAVMFDHRTRMIVSRKPDGANTWSRGLDASEDIQQKTAEVFNDLFKKTSVEVPGAPQAGSSAFNIETRMKELQKLVQREGGRMSSPRNIAYAEVHTTAGQREIYVSVSGAQNDTGSLPLFANAESGSSVMVADTTYFNIDAGDPIPPTSLKQTPEGKLLAVPHTVEDPRWYSPDLTKRPTSLDTESKLIDAIRQKYTDLEDIKSVNIATTLPPCDSCSVVMKQFGYDGASDALNVVWGDRARASKRKLDASSSSSSDSA